MLYMSRIQTKEYDNTACGTSPKAWGGIGCHVVTEGVKANH